MTAGRQAPRYQAMALIYPKSKALQNYLCEYFIVITHVCHRVQYFTQKSALGQLATSLSDSDLKGFQSDLELWSTSIKEEATFLLTQHHESQARLNATTRAVAARWSLSAAHRFNVGKKMKWLDSCSTYDFQTTWKQIQKLGKTSLLEKSTSYQQWKRHNSAASAIIIGKIGAGKSVTMANIVSDLSHDKEAIILYFFCRYDVPESLKHRTILGSLARQYLNYFSISSDVFESELFTPRLSLEDFARILDLDIMRDAQKYIILDGLDDCGVEERRIVLRQLMVTERSSKWHLGISAQLSADAFIRTHLNPNWDISLPTENPDIESFIDVELKARIRNGILVVGDPGLIPDIKSALLQGANGM